MGPDAVAETGLDEDATTTVNLVQAENEVMGDPIDSVDHIETASVAEEPVALSEDEVEALVGAKMGMEGIEVHIVKGHKFVKLKDLLPPPPVRGSFDVEQIRDSQYFFS